MGIEYFLFALMLFGMVLIVFFLFFSGKSRARKAEENEWAEKKEKLMLLYFEVQDMIDGLRDEVKNAVEWAESQRRQRSEPERPSIEREQRGDDSREQEVAPPLKDKQPEILAGKIAQMHKNGMSESEIAESLMVSRNEIKFALSCIESKISMDNY